MSSSHHLFDQDMIRQFVPDLNIIHTSSSTHLEIQVMTGKQKEKERIFEEDKKND